MVDVDAPVAICGTSLGVLGDARAACGSPAGDSGGRDGSVVDVDVPVTVCGTGIALLGHASGSCSLPGGTPGTPTPGDGGPGEDRPSDGVDVPVTGCGTSVAVLGTAAAGCTDPGRGPVAPDVVDGPDGPSTPSRPGDGSSGAPLGTVVPVVASGGPLTGMGTGTVAVDAPVALRGDAGHGGRLAYTGTALTRPVLAGAVAALLGLALMVAARRRRLATTH